MIEVADRKEERHLPTAANAAITWLTRDGIPAGRSPRLLDALRQMTLRTDAMHAWLAGEIETMRTLRRYLIEEEGIARADIRAAGYWRLGEAGAHGRVED